MSTAELQAGREMDAAVHRGIFGAAVPCLHAEVTNVAGSLVRCDACGRQFGSTTLAMARSYWPDYSTDIRAAMEVWDELHGRLTSRGHCDEIRLTVRLEGAKAEIRDIEHGVTIAIATVDPREVSDEAEPSDALPLAICRASLAALDAAIPPASES